MSIILVSGLSFKWTLTDTIKVLLQVIKGNFEALKLETCKLKGKRQCYLRLSERLDPLEVIDAIHRTTFKGQHLTASIPDPVPDLTNYKAQRIPIKLRRQLKISLEDNPRKIILGTHRELMIEINYKFIGLNRLEQKSGFKLIYNIAMIVLSRLKKIMIGAPDDDESCFKLSKKYRRKYPHSSDFQLITSTMYQIEITAGKPRTNINKSDIVARNPQQLMTIKLPSKDVNAVGAKISNRITTRIQQHLMNLNMNPCAQGTEEIATMRVREELKKMSTFMPAIINEVVMKDLVPTKAPFYQMRMYGDPNLPPKEVVINFMKKFRATKFFRSTRIFNSLMFTVPAIYVASVLAEDGTVLAGFSKLTIRLGSIRHELKFSLALRNAINSSISELESEISLGLMEAEQENDPGTHEMFVEDNETQLGDWETEW